MENPIPVGRGKIPGNAISTIVEWLLVLVIVCLAASIAAVWLLRPAAETEIAKFRALDLVLTSPLPGPAGQTCGTAVSLFSQQSGASAHWQVEPQDKSDDYLVTLTLVGEQAASFHWNVSLSGRSVAPVEGRTICPGR